MDGQDLCQALGFPPERKYQQEGGPLIRDCIGLLRERIVDLCGRCSDGLRNKDVLGATTNPVMAERVADIIQERAASLLQGLRG